MPWSARSTDAGSGSRRRRSPARPASGSRSYCAGATPAETFELLCRAYALTPRERQVVAALIAGDDTRAVTERLVISPHTVQDHLKSIFAKAGVRSRRELVTRFNGTG